jgi:exopolysaccharide production protein ExoZ
MRRFPYVQALRAGAAAAVAFTHIANDAVTAGRDPTHFIACADAAMPWASGVDIFFVISGFVIVHASAPLFGRPGGAATFLRHRLARIVPLYWGLTTLLLLADLLAPAAINHAPASTAYILASYLFIPWPRSDGLIQPALSLGWTLNYEMFFYLLLAATIRLPRLQAVLLTTAILLLLVATGAHTQPQLVFWTNPIVLEFAAGMLLALAVAHGLTVPNWLRLLAVPAALALLHLNPALPRPLALGLPAALLVAAAVTARNQERPTALMRAMTRMGDASYALYLVHPFVMRALTMALPHDHTEASGLLYVAVALVVSQLVALAINTGIEKKITSRLRSAPRHPNPGHP